MRLTHSVGVVLQKPVLSPDGKYLAAIAADERVHLISLAEAAHGRRFITTLKVPRSTRAFLKECYLLRWSPETMSLSADIDAEEVLSNTTSECEYGTTWILLSNGSRLIALSTALRSPSMMPGAVDELHKSNILADYDLGGQYGKLSLVEFVFNHRHALVMFEVGTTAAVLSLVKPQRNEIAHVKFANAQSFAAAPGTKYFALLRRDRSQDRVTVFELEADNSITFKSFDVDTLDAQGLKWCPAGGPVLAVCDSPAYGARVCFYTAQGHALKQLDITSAVFTQGPVLPNGHAQLPPKTEGVGITSWKWSTADGETRSKSTRRTVQAAADGQKRVVVRYVDTRTMAIEPLASFGHPETIDGSKTLVWQERADQATAGMSTPPTFTRYTGSFETTHSSEMPAQTQNNNQGQVDLITINSAQTTAATRLRSAPRTLFLWKLKHNAPSHPDSVLIFTHGVRQALWHPWLANVLLIITASKIPRVYAWFQEKLPPISGVVPLDTRKSINFSATWLPQCAREGNHSITSNANSSTARNSITDSDKNNTHNTIPNTTTTSKRCPFLISSTSAFQVGLLSHGPSQITFEGVLHPPPADLTLNNNTNHTPNITSSSCFGNESEDTTRTNTSVIDTPSRPSRIAGAGATTVLTRKKARFDGVPPNPRTDRSDDPLHSEAKYRRW